MLLRAVVLVVALGMGHMASARTIINEWGGHTSADYVIDRVGVNDVGVRILANTQPTREWKFEAYDSITGAPADISYIRIWPQAIVGDIDLSVIGNPGATPPHTHGAANLGRLDLVTNGAATNIINVIDISGDYGAIGAMRAYSAMTITIDGDLGPYGIDIDGPIFRNISINGAGPHYGSLTFGGGAGTTYHQDIYFGGSMADTTEIVVNATLAGTITINGDLWDCTTHSIPVGGSIWVMGDLRGHVTQAAYSDQMAGCIAVDGNMQSSASITCGVVIYDSKLAVEGDAAGDFYIQTVDDGAFLLVRGDLTGDVYCDSLVGGLFVEGDVIGTIDCAQLFSGAIDIGGKLTGGITMPDVPMSGTVTVTGDVSNPDAVITTSALDGQVTVGGDFAGKLLVGSPTTSGTLSGSVAIGEQLSGAIMVYGDVPDGASIEIGEQLATDNTGGIEVHGDVGGDLHFWGGLADAASAGCGHILIDGSLLSTGSIDIDGAIVDHSYVTIDYDGYDPGDDWNPNAPICLGTPETCYYGNSAANHLYHTTCLKGDADNSGSVTTDDLDPFSQALEGVGGNYCDLFPGLCGSMLTHIDTDCSGSIDDTDDWTAFQLRLYYPTTYYTQYPACEDCN